MIERPVGRTDRKFMPGDPVRFNAVTGSWGVVLGANHYGGYYVKWNYGQDVYGEAITEKGSYKPHELVPVPKELYQRYIACRAWSDEQKRIATELVT